jgi:hypothetical protein
MVCSRCGHRDADVRPWKWDGSLDLGDDLEELKRAWDDVCALVDEHGEDPAFKRLVAEEVGADADRQRLFDLANCNTDFSDLMDRVHIRSGEGWQTDGILGGSGHNLYVGDRKKLTSAIDWYQGIQERLKAPSLRRDDAAEEKGGARMRRVIDRWRNTDVNGNRLRLDSMTTKITKVASFQETICEPSGASDLLNRIRAVQSSSHARAARAHEELVVNYWGCSGSAPSK